MRPKVFEHKLQRHLQHASLLALHLQKNTRGVAMSQTAVRLMLYNTQAASYLELGSSCSLGAAACDLEKSLERS